MMRHNFRADLHIHSQYSFDNRRGPSVHQILARAHDLSLQAVAITDHDVILKWNNLESLGKSYELIVVPGVEISSNRGHILGLGIHDAIPEQLDPKQTIAMIHEQDGVAVAAHPYDPNLGLGDLIYDLNLDAIEINGRRPRKYNSMAKTAAKTLGIPLVGGSDAHKLDHIGAATTLFEEVVTTVDELLLAIKKARVRGSRSS